MEYLIPIWWPSVSKIVQKHRGTKFSHCSYYCKTASNSEKQNYLLKIKSCFVGKSIKMK